MSKLELERSAPMCLAPAPHRDALDAFIHLHCALGERIRHFPPDICKTYNPHSAVSQTGGGALHSVFSSLLPTQACTCPV